MASWKRWTQGLLWMCCAVGGLFWAESAFAATQERPDVYVDGEWIRFDVQPQVYQDRTLVPMRMIFEALGADVSWEEATQTAVATKDGVTLRLPIGQTVVTENGKPITLDVPAKLVQDRTMVPVRFVAESFGDQVLWNGTVGRVTIHSANAPKIRVIGDDAYHLQDGMTAAVQEMVRQSSLTELVQSEIDKSFQQPVWIYLSNSATGYQQNISKYGEDPEAAAVANTAEGVTYGSHILIPLDKLTDERLRVQTVAHELMHALLNQNGGLTLPSWVHEGLAWQTGLDAEFHSDPAVMRQQMDGMLRDYVLGIVVQGKYQSLHASRAGTLDTLDRAGYNIELQDYLAYRYYVQMYGKQAFLNYLNAYSVGGTNAFQTATGISESMFDQNFKQYLEQETKRTSNGMEITLNVPSDFHGELHLLLQGSGATPTKKLLVQPGKQTIRIYRDGRIEGVPTETAHDSADRDKSSLYLFVDLEQAVKDQGVRSNSGGMGFYDSYGEYYYGYAWLNTETQGALYPSTNRVLGVELVDVRAF